MLRAPKRWSGEKAVQNPEKVAVFCEKVENYCAKVPLFSQVCSAKLIATLWWVGNRWTIGAKQPVVCLRTKENLPFAAWNTAKEEAK